MEPLPLVQTLIKRRIKMMTKQNGAIFFFNRTRKNLMEYTAEPAYSYIIFSTFLVIVELRLAPLSYIPIDQSHEQTHKHIKTSAGGIDRVVSKLGS